MRPCGIPRRVCGLRRGGYGKSTSGDCWREGCEWRAAQLFGVESQRMTLGRNSSWKPAGHGFSGELIQKAGLILELTNWHVEPSRFQVMTVILTYSAPIRGPAPVCLLFARRVGPAEMVAAVSHYKLAIVVHRRFDPMPNRGIRDVGDHRLGGLWASSLSTALCKAQIPSTAGALAIVS